MSDWQEVLAIKEKLSILKELDKDFRVFGSSTHKYELSAPLSETRIESFEKENRLKLPADYRLFLTAVGNGGAGPYYGICNFERAIFGCKPGEAFKWTSEASIKFEDDNDYDKWGDHQPGIFVICEQGCAAFQFLVVNGICYGEIWTDWFYELTPDNSSFSEFYHDWLDTYTAQINNIPVIKSVKNGMTKTDLIGLFGNDWSERKPESNEKAEIGDQKVVLTFKSVYGSFLLDRGLVVKVNNPNR